MSTFNIPLESIKKETLEKLLNVVPEGRQIDYKRELNFKTPEHKRELYKDVASFEPLLVFQKSLMTTSSNKENFFTKLFWSPTTKPVT